MNTVRVMRLRPVAFVAGVAREWIERFVSVQGVDRAMAIGAQGYTALIPLLIVYASVLPRKEHRSFADDLIHHLELSGNSATAIRDAFAPRGAVQSGVTALSVVLLIISALSFTRALQRMYEHAFELRPRGIRDTKWDLLWLAVVCVFALVRPLASGGLSGHAETVVGLAMNCALWLLTPYMLLGRRLSWRRLAPAAVLCTTGMAGVGIYTVIWLPHALASSAKQFGVIGVGFALLTWLVAIAGVIIVATTGGAMIAERLRPREAREA